MKKSKSIIFVLGIAIGLALGIFLVEDFYGAMEGLEEYCASGIYGDFASNIQYRRATPEKAKEALLACIAFRKELDTVDTDRTKKLDIGLGYGRVALLEESDGNAQEAKAHLAKAKEYFREAGYEKRTSTEADLRAFIAFWDGRGKLPASK